MLFGRVTLDTCTLHPIGLCDLLLRLAKPSRDLYSPVWSNQILAELRGSLVSHANLTEAAADVRIGHMRRAFPDAEVDSPDHLVERMTNDPGDRHVLATAVVSQSDAIVTANVRHFPPEACARWGVDVYAPDDFLTTLHAEEPEIVLQTLVEQVNAMRNPPSSVDAVLQRLEMSAPRFAVALRAQIDTYEIEEYAERLLNSSIVHERP